MDIAELSRRLENILRIGTIAQVDHATQRVRVATGELITDWLKWRTARAGATRIWEPPTVGEQCLILSPSGELGNGIVLPAIYCDANDTPSADPDEHVTLYPDGARIVYNHATGALVASGLRTALVQASESVTADTPFTHATGDVEIDGNLTVHGTATIDELLRYGNGITGHGGHHGNSISGDFNHVDGNLSSNGIVLHTHIHEGTGGPL